MAVPVVRLEAGRVVGRYRVVRLLGAGGMGAVYEAEHVELGKTVALKVMLPDMTTDTDLVGRFMNEARAAARIGHPGIVETFDLGTDAGLAYIAMEKLEGEELQRRIEREKRLAVDFVCRIGIELSDAMAAAHAQGIIHRDLKPANVFLVTKGRSRDVVKVLDFGVAKLTQGSTSDVETRTGAVFGTPLYMAPEQLRDSKQVDARTDVYAIGAIVYHALAGKPPFLAPTLPELMYRITTVPPPPLREIRSDVPPAIVAVIERALAKEPAARFARATDLAEALERGSRGAPAAGFDRTERVVSTPLEQKPVPAEANTADPIGRTTTDLPPLSGTSDESTSRLWPFALVSFLIVGAGVLSVFLLGRKAEPPSPAMPAVVSSEPAHEVSPKSVPEPPALASAPPPTPSVSVVDKPVPEPTPAQPKKPERKVKPPTTTPKVPEPPPLLPR